MAIQATRPDTHHTPLPSPPVSTDAFAADTAAADDEATPTSPLAPSPAATKPGHERRWQRRGLSVAAGLLTTASVPPFGWWPLALVGLGLLPVALELGPRRGQRFGTGFLFALTLYIPSLWWLTQFSLPGGIVIALIEVIITALTIALLIPKPTAPRSLVTVAHTTVAIVAADALRCLWPFGGLPLGGIDLGQADGPFAALVTFGGRLLLIGIVSFLGGTLVLIARRGRPSRPGRHAQTAALVGPALAALTCLTLTAAAHALPDGTHANRTLRMAIAQGSGPLGVKATDNGLEKAFQAHVAATNLIQSPVDLILWPENVTDVVKFATAEKRTIIGELATKFNAPIVAGVVEDDPDPKYFDNFSIVVSPGGDIGDGRATRYDKVRPVPFGERVYLRSLLTRFAGGALQPKDMRQGTRPGAVSTPFGTFAIIISYEGFFDDRARSGVRAGGQALLIPTNASSFVTSHLPTQQVAAARLRARETGRWVAQAAPTGISAVIRPDGTIVTRSGIQQRVALQSTITLRRGLTPYARWNDTPALAATALLGLAATVAGMTRRRATRQET